ncbi:TIGR01777 family oxidoreductase [Methylobacterium planeticum]|uniref:TIGR01777 family protein n=1 Tax=Methylobacterium planeticum TaxID=2615211 RepID=A0A6N6MS37_9HYPH|nr:TIGR01777 family oxidoreductase [Methylobacterium planeticum]KAB1072345.1 TIGR01777 family protein [Methylobacterium planeticum]
MTSTLLWWLIAVQIAMGAFDTLYHHELTERLAWRPSQRGELRLHAVRNALYAALFLTLGFAEPRGWLAALTLTVLLAEVGITLADFVEEDLSRRLPASERINHTLLALNYGGILVLIVPILLIWAGEPTALPLTTHGAWSALAVSAALGVAVFGARDWLAAARSERLAEPSAVGLASALSPGRRILVTGGTGFVGRRLVAALVASGHKVTVLTREAPRAAALPAPHAVVTSLDQIPDDARFDAAVNLAGEPVADGLWTRARRRRILASRLRVTGDLRRLIARLDHRPAVVISASAVGWYGVRDDAALTEASAAGGGFTHRVCAAWEREAGRIDALGPRVVILRFGLVLAVEGGVLARFLTPFEFGLGGPVGDGRQWMSWITRDDLVRLIVHAIVEPSLAGPVNATAPNPVRNAEFARALGAALRRPARVPVPAWPLVRIGGDYARELLIGGQRVLPEAASAAGFRFLQPDLAPALIRLLGAKVRLAQDDPHVEARSLPSAP